MRRRVWGLFFIFLGGFFIFLSNFKITGEVIALYPVGVSIFTFIGLVFFAGGLILLISHDSVQEYYSRRVKEIFDPKYDAQDVWIARGEVSGIINELKNNSLYKKLDIEHGNNAPTIHLVGGKNTPVGILHMNVKTKDISRHLFITENPNDSRLENVGINPNSKKVERIKSKVYSSNYPRINTSSLDYVETASPSEKKAA